MVILVGDSCRNREDKFINVNKALFSRKSKALFGFLYTTIVKFNMSKWFRVVADYEIHEFKYLVTYTMLNFMWTACDNDQQLNKRNPL